MARLKCEMLSPLGGAEMEVSLEFSAVDFVGAHRGLAKRLGGIYTQVLRLFFTWLPSCQNFSIRFPALLCPRVLQVYNKTAFCLFPAAVCLSD